MAGVQKFLNPISYAMTALGQIQQGRYASAIGKAQQAYNNQAAQQQRAVAQREAFEEKRRTDLLVSRAVAVAGGGAGDPTVLDIISDIEGEGAYRAAVAVYGGEARAQQLEYEGGLAAAQGKEVRKQVVMNI